MGTHGLLWNGILAVYSFDDLAFFVLFRTDEVIVRILAFEAVCVSHGDVRRCIELNEVESLESWRDRGLDEELIYLSTSPSVCVTLVECSYDFLSSRTLFRTSSTKSEGSDVE